MWKPGWEAKLLIEYDADAFQLTDVASLLHRAGKTVGIGEGRHDSRECNGMGFGCFTIVQSEAT
jgi:hypothetical protein